LVRHTLSILNEYLSFSLIKGPTGSIHLLFPREILKYKPRMKPERRILIIEDDADDEVLLLRQLKKAQLEKHVRVMHDGTRAIAYLKNPRWECENLAAVFLDLKLPKATGVEVLRKMRADARLDKVPVIVMTSSNSPEELEECRSLGIALFVAKPLTLSSFAKAFADLFHARQISSRETPAYAE
jgi:two-component system response regulator